MAKVKRPIVSGEASGTLGGDVVYSSWRGVKYARRHVVPANPNTVEQQKTRDVFSWLNDGYKIMPPLLREVWDIFSRGEPMTDRNAFIKINVPLLREATDLTNYVASPGAGGGFPLASLSASSPSAGTVQAIATISPLPTGWAVRSVIFAVLRDQDPHGDFMGRWEAREVTASPYQVTISGLTAGRYLVAAYAKFTRPDGRTAFGPSLNAFVTVA